MTERRHTVLDGSRQLHFDGELLAAASSHEPDKTRWIELELYRTDQGRYIVAGIGRSEMEGERDRNWVHVSDTAHGAIESFHLYDEDGVRYLTKIARSVLEAASRIDEGIKTAFQSEVVG